MSDTRNAKLKFTLKRVRMTADGAYEIGTRGRYFGHGRPLYRAVYDDPNGPDVRGTPWCAHGWSYIEYEIRAGNRDHAKALVREVYPNATFYN